jgi:putative tryptophan/tyrosine transport system substrate-binding protein
MMISREAFIAGIAAIVMARPAGAQSTARVYRLGVLGVGRRLTDAQGSIASKLRELGWEEGRNLSIDYRFADSPDAMPQLSARLVASKTDVLVALGTFPAHALKDATQSIPIVFGAVADPVGRGLVASLARPGGNVTGASHFGNFEGKPAELLKELVPRAQRMVWLINPANPSYRTSIVMERNIDQLS